MSKNRIEWEDADYHDEQNPEYRDNPLIRALRPSPSEPQLFASFAKLPPRRDDSHRSASLSYRLAALGAIQNTYIPFQRDYDAFYQIYDAMCFCYAPRNPANPEVMRAIMQGMNGEYNMLERQSDSGGGANGLVLYGSTGMGKTSMTDRFLDFLGAPVVYHRQLDGRPCRWPQIKYIRVQASPTEGSLTWLAESVAARVDALFGTRFRARFGSRIGLTKYVLQMASAASSHLLGLLIVDDAQNISEVSKSRLIFLKTLSTFMEATGIPVLLISTYKAIPVITEDLMYGSKLMAQGTSEFRAFELGEEWTTFLEALWESHPFPLNVEMPLNFSQMIHWHSQGILRIARELLVALFTYMARQGIYVPTMDLLDYISADKLRHYQSSLSTLRQWRQGLKFSRDEYKVFSDLIPPATGLPQLRDDIALRKSQEAKAVAPPASPKESTPANTSSKRSTPRAKFAKGDQDAATRILKAENRYEALRAEGWVLTDILGLQ